MRTITEKVSLIKQGKLTAEKNVADFGEKIQKKNKELNIFLSLNTQAIEQAKEIDKRIKEKKPVGKLAGICVGVKSNIAVKGMETNCASKVLESYISGYDATTIEKLKNEDAIIIGMVNMDEFACGGSGETSAFGPVKNPINPELIPGGSSSGSAAAVAADFCDFSLGSDTGGSIRNPASHCNVIGLKPSYGVVSRYGLLDLSMSLDQIGPLAKSVEDAKLIFDIIKGQDNFDCSSKEAENKEKNEKSNKTLTLGLVNVQDFSTDKRIYELIKKRAEEVTKKNGWKIQLVNLPLDIAIQAYYILVYTEFFSSTRKYDGRRFGEKIEDAAGPEVLRRILGGSEISKAEYHGKYYRDALKAKAFVKEQFEKLFEKVDFLVLPTVPKLPHKIGEKISVEEMYAYDVFTIPANLGEICAISLPAGKIDSKPVGMQIFCPKFEEDLLFEIGEKFEE